jgi:hypothetical protein
MIHQWKKALLEGPAGIFERSSEAAAAAIVAEDRCCLAYSHTQPSPPSAPVPCQPLAISCGSWKIVFVPWGMTAAANSAGISMPDAMCMWPSQRPGIRNWPVASTTNVAGPMQCLASGQTYANRPSATATCQPGRTSRFGHSPSSRRRSPDQQQCARRPQPPAGGRSRPRKGEECVT